MHPQRWGDPAAAAALPDAARGLVELAFGARRAPRRSSAPTLPAAGARRRRCSTALRDVRRRRARAHRRRDPAAAHPRQVDPRPAARPRRRPGRRPRRRGPARRRTTRSRPCSRCAVEHHVAVVPFGGGTCVTGGLAARRDGYAGVVSLDLVRMKRLLAVDPVSMTADPRARAARPRGRGAARRARADARPLPAVVRVRLDRRLRRHPVQRPVQRRLRPLRRAGRRPHASPRRRATLRLGSAPANAAGPDLRQLVLGSEGAFGVITSVTVRVRQAARGEGLRGLALAVLRRRRRRDAHARPGRAAADRAPALRRGRDRDQPRPTRRRSAATSRPAAA